jgi:hypothetical protein
MANPEGIRNFQDILDRVRARTELRVIKTPPSPKRGVVTVYARLNGGGKTELVVQHPTGAVQIVSTEP